MPINKAPEAISSQTPAKEQARPEAQRATLSLAQRLALLEMAAAPGQDPAIKKEALRLLEMF